MRRRPPKALVAVSGAVGLLFIAPFAYVVTQNLRLGADFGEILTDGDTWATLRRSFSLAIFVSVSAAVIGTGLAWTVVRTDVPFKKLLAVIAPLPLVFPSFVGATALISGFATGGLLEQIVEPAGISLPELRGFRAAWFVLTLFTYPYVYLPVAARLRHLPRSFEESGRILGRSPAEVFGTIVWPQIRTATSAGALLVFLYTISDFGAVELLRYDTFTRKIYANQLADRGTAMAFSLMLGIIALAVVAAERSLIRRDPPAPVATPTRPAYAVSVSSRNDPGRSAGSTASVLYTSTRTRPVMPTQRLSAPEKSSETRPMIESVRSSRRSCCSRKPTAPGLCEMNTSAGERSPSVSMSNAISEELP